MADKINIYLLAFANGGRHVQFVTYLLLDMSRHR